MKQMREDLSPIKSESPDGKLEIDRAVELRAMANMLRRSDGFTLAFAQCNQPSERRKLVSELRQFLGDYPIAEIEFTEPIEYLLDELLPRLPKHNNADALFIYGLEHSIRPNREFSPLVANLNTSRNSFPRYISYPLVLWLPAFAITAIMRGAPDFFSWRSALYQFPSSHEMLYQISQDALAGDVRAVLNLTLEEKKERIAVIENLFADYESFLPDKRDRRAEAGLIHRLAMLYHSLGDYVKAEGFYHRSLEIGRELDDKNSISSSLHQLGIIAQFRGNYEEAEHYYQQSLSIKEKLGNKIGIASSLHQLGTIAQEQGTYEEAERYYRQSLNIRKELGDKIGIAYSLHQLGIIAQFRGDYEEAEHYYRRSWNIFESLGNKSDIAISLHNVGLIAQEQGAYEEAKRYYQQSLKISEKLGNRNIIAISLGQLGVIAEEQRKHEQAVRLTAAALAIFEKIGSPNQEVARENLERLRGQVEKTRFETLFNEAYTDPEKVVREILSIHPVR
jgi:tetratricopeptide (TPR) repeat protein